MTRLEFKNSLQKYDTGITYRWSRQRVNEWYEKNGWIIGCNYVPATAINQLEMWQAETFDPFTIDKELSWAAGLGFNTIRVFLHHLVWEQQPQKYLRRIGQFLNIAFKHGIKTMFVLFDSVWNPNPRSGKQPEPRLNVHNSGWVQCPGYDVLNDTIRHNELHSYVHGIIDHFKNDERVIVWDLFNEPDNMNLTSYKDDTYAEHKAELSLQLLKKTINWVRMIDPSQPVTMAPWQWMDMETLSTLDNFMFTQSDIISFHCYENKEGMGKRINALKRFGRPVICTEYMARPFGSTFQEILPLLKENNIGACNWGFVQGRSQTHYPWDSWQATYTNKPGLWFHDIFSTNGEAYNKDEVAFLQQLNNADTMVIQKVA